MGALFLILFSCTSIMILITPFFIYLFHHSAVCIKEHIFGNSKETHNKKISFTNIGICVVSLIFYFVNEEDLFFYLGLLTLITGIPIFLLLRLITHEHPSMLYKLQGLDSTLPLSAYAIRSEIRNSMLKTHHTLNTEPLATREAIYRIGDSGVYIRS